MRTDESVLAAAPREDWPEPVAPGAGSIRAVNIEKTSARLNFRIVEIHRSAFPGSAANRLCSALLTVSDCGGRGGRDSG
jgi:hypothetical protein